MRAINRIVLHHTASSRTRTTIRDITNWHKGKIAYHYVVLGDGKWVPTARRLPTAGAHAKGANFDTIAIAIAGDNRKPGKYEDRTVRENDGWQQPQIVSARDGIASCLHLMPWLTLHGHRHVGTTKTFCPGPWTEARLRELFLP